MVGRCFYGIGIAGIGIQQFIYSAFRPVLLQYWPVSIPGVSFWAYITGAVLMLAGAIIIFSKNARILAFALGMFFFLLFVCCHVYYQLFLSPNDFHLGSCTDALKELALSGGAFLIAASFPKPEIIFSQ